MSTPAPTPAPTPAGTVSVDGDSTLKAIAIFIGIGTLLWYIYSYLPNKRKREAIAALLADPANTEIVLKQTEVVISRGPQTKESRRRLAEIRGARQQLATMPVVLATVIGAAPMAAPMAAPKSYASEFGPDLKELLIAHAYWRAIGSPSHTYLNSYWGSTTGPTQRKDDFTAWLDQDFHRLFLAPSVTGRLQIRASEYIYHLPAFAVGDVQSDEIKLAAILGQAYVLEMIAIGNDGLLELNDATLKGKRDGILLKSFLEDTVPEWRMIPMDASDDVYAEADYWARQLYGLKAEFEQKSLTDSIERSVWANYPTFSDIPLIL